MEVFGSYVLTANRRSSLFVSGRYELGPQLGLHFETLYTDRNSEHRAAPQFSGLGPNAATGGIADSITIPASQPFNPFGIDLVSGDNLRFIGRRVAEGGIRRFEQQVDTVDVSTGLDGRFTLAGRNLARDLNLMASRNRADQDFTGGYNIQHIVQALGTSESCAAIAGCLPLNIFGGQGAGTAAAPLPQRCWTAFHSRSTVTCGTVAVAVATYNYSKNSLQIGFCKILALEQQRQTARLGERVAEYVPKIQAGCVTAALAIGDECGVRRIGFCLFGCHDLE